MHELHTFAQHIFASQPFSRFIGAQLTAVGKDHAELTLAIQEHHTQQHGFVHGGVLSYLADNDQLHPPGTRHPGNRPRARRECWQTYRRMPV